MRLSAYFLPTLREDPAEAEVVSHRLMLRAGMIRRVAAGVYSYLPLGYRALRKVEGIIRREMDRAGALEVFLPVLSPAELWKETGRWEIYGRELMRLQDRHGRDFCLGPTHEEVITDLVRRDVNSWRQLPLNLYQIQTKFRDEIRPRFGLMRGREFGMKDAYSFDRGEEGAQKSYETMFETYTRIFRECGLNFKAVEADSGPIGGAFSHEFMVLADTGEDLLLNCGECGYAANLEKAEIAAPENPAETEEPLPLEERSTPGRRTVEEVSQFLECTPASLVKTLLYQADDGVVAVLVRGDHQVNVTKLKNHLAAGTLEPASPEKIEAATGGPTGFSGPVGLEGVRVVADAQIRHLANFVTGSNAADGHLVNVNFERDFKVSEWADVKAADAGDPCPRCRRPMETIRGIEVGHVFKLGTKYSEAMKATYLDEEGREQTIVMGCYGIGTGRTVAASVEQNHDEHGIIWPVPLAPFPVTLLTLSVKDSDLMEASERLVGELEGKGIEVLWDDRDERPGVKFKDAELVGIPYRITVGPKGLKEGKVELVRRKTREARSVDVQKAAETVAESVLEERNFSSQI
jgi:prolyl-tRNA synthetase